MEAAGLAASIIGIVQLAGKLTSIGYGYISSVARAPKDLRELSSELISLSQVLETLLDYTDTNPHSPALQKLTGKEGPLEGCARELRELESKLELKGVLDRIKWPLKEKETMQHISQIERHKSLFTFALTADNISLSKVIERYTKDTNFTVQGLRADFQSEAVAQEDWRQKEGAIRMEETRKKALDWISPGDFDTKHLEISRQRQGDTGRWLLETPKYKKLINRQLDPSLLWGYGIPGAGKTFLSSVVIDSLQDLAVANSYGVAYIYFYYKEQDQQTPAHVIASLVKQLASQIANLPAEIGTLYGKLAVIKKPTLEELYTALLSTFKHFHHVFFIFDALDECHPENQRRGLLPLFHRLGRSGASLFLTSRQYPEDIQESFCDVAQIELSATGGDIKSYIQEKIEESPRARRLVRQAKCEDRIISELTHCANGMFLLVRFHIEYICQQTTAKQVLVALEKLKTSPAGKQQPLDPTYDRVVESIRNQPEECSDMAIKVLSWLVKARRTLTVTELQVAISVEPNRYELDELDIPDKRTILDVCAGLVVIDEINTIRLAHFTVQEYLLRKSVVGEGAKFYTAMACTTFLSFDTFLNNNITYLYTDWQQRFLGYATSYLRSHIEDCDEALSTDMVLIFLERPGCVQSFLQSTTLSGGGALQTAAYLGHYAVTKVLLDREADMDSSVIYRALKVAVVQGHQALVQLFLEKGAGISAPDDYWGVLLHLAAKYGNEAIVRLLLEKGADISAPGYYGAVALHLAAGRGHEAIVRLLLEKGVDISAPDNDGRVALHFAVGCGHEDIVRLLLEKGADISAPECYGMVALHFAAECGHEAIVRLLLEKGAEISAPGDDGKAALHFAAERGHEAIVWLLLDKGADISAPDNDGRVALHSAMTYGYEATVRLLLEKGADISAPDNDGRVALHFAAEYGHEAIVRLLLEKGADVSALDNDGRVALHLAAEYRHEAVVQLLQEMEADKLGLTTNSL